VTTARAREDERAKLRREAGVHEPPDEAAGCVPCYACGGFREPGAKCGRAGCPGDWTTLRAQRDDAREGLRALRDVVGRATCGACGCGYLLTPCGAAHALVAYWLGYAHGIGGAPPEPVVPRSERREVLALIEERARESERDARILHELAEAIEDGLHLTPEWLDKLRAHKESGT
jgi:hypothetical protein